MECETLCESLGVVEVEMLLIEEEESEKDEEETFRGEKGFAKHE